ncbi:hypothetical protein [Streptacidiphilus sp. P02-A3a]|uniref:helix-turn-helix transcriptional regulator n=1 Tax=Streptacidiphilus sp. P02-A3a TaxID=2704468 RepID=UPI0015F961C8|nr:hypothetical protein [Streptacidiphilus sp. P02-A3a]QMU70245.1 hypothetical protein GXP74_20510 [Streptacidiphilus sp. P02-A3a]QMU70299.1 hypothetical protein GXP74_20865 [Streptacidiphilus sp. P02-A3a]
MTIARQYVARLPKTLISLLYSNPQDQWSMQELATFFGVSPATIQRILDAQGTPKRPRSTKRRGPTSYRSPGDKKVRTLQEDLERRYDEVGETLADLAHLYQIDYRLLKSEIERWRTPERPRAESQRAMHRQLAELGDFSVRTRIVEMFTQGSDAGTIAERYGVGEMAVRRVLGGMGALTFAEAQDEVIPAAPAPEQLSARAWTILRSTAVGIPRAELAEQLHITPPAIVRNFYRITTYFGAQCTREAIARAVETGQIDRANVLASTHPTVPPERLPEPVQQVVAGWLMARTARQIGDEQGLSARTVVQRVGQLRRLTGSRSQDHCAAIIAAVGYTSHPTRAAATPAADRKGRRS